MTSEITHKAEQMMRDRLQNIERLEHCRDNLAKLESEIEEARAEMKAALEDAAKSGWSKGDLAELGFVKGRKPAQKRRPAKKKKAPEPVVNNHHEGEQHHLGHMNGS